MNLPTRPTKQSDSRSRNFEGESVEVDAIEPNTLRLLTEERITQHIDLDALRRLETIEQQERETLRNLAVMVGNNSATRTARSQVNFNPRESWTAEEYRNHIRELQCELRQRYGDE